MLFLRAFRYFGAYFAIIIGVAKKVFSFLVILFVFILSFSHAFYIYLKPRAVYTSFDQSPPLSDIVDDNDPWNLVDKFLLVFQNGTAQSTNYAYVQQPDKNTNLFTNIGTSTLAMYNFLTGNFINQSIN